MGGNLNFEIYKLVTHFSHFGEMTKTQVQPKCTSDIHLIHLMNLIHLIYLIHLIHLIHIFLYINIENDKILKVFNLMTIK